MSLLHGQPCLWSQGQVASAQTASVPQGRLAFLSLPSQNISAEGFPATTRPRLAQDVGLSLSGGGGGLRMAQAVWPFSWNRAARGERSRH